MRKTKETRFDRIGMRSSAAVAYDRGHRDPAGAKILANRSATPAGGAAISATTLSTASPGTGLTSRLDFSASARNSRSAASAAKAERKAARRSAGRSGGA